VVFGPGLLNAIKRDASPALVATGSAIFGPFDNEAIVVRKALVDSGQVKSPADLKGRKFGISGRNSAADWAMTKAFKPYGMALNDLDLQVMPFPDIYTALGNGAL